MIQGGDDENMGDGEEAAKTTSQQCAEDDALLGEYVKRIESDAHEQSCVL